MCHFKFVDKLSTIVVDNPNTNSVFSDALSGDESSEDETDETDGKKRQKEKEGSVTT